MAEIRAIANGNWNSASTWDLNRIPDANDDVYLNNHILSWSGSRAVCHNLYLQNTNDYFSTAFQITANHIFINITTSAFRFGVNCIGDIDISGGQIGGAGGAVDITGNILLTNGAILLGNVSGASYANCTINGNIYVENGANLRISGSSHRNFTVNGTITIEETVTSAIYTVSSQGWDFYATRILNKSTYTLISGTMSAGYVFEVGELISPNAYVFDTLQSRPIRIGIADVLNIYNISRPITINSLTTHTLSFPIIEGVHIEGNIISNPNANIKVYSVEQTTYLQPNEDEVKKDVIYDGGNRIGSYAPDYPPESVVLKDYEYGDSDDRKIGTMVQEVNVEVGCVTPEDVRKDVPLVGMGVVGSLVVPSVDDVREGVVFDNGSVGTLIVEGGGDRLRIADFGYYTNAQSDTYIVDLTELDKPKFAVAEERVLIEMFPELDFDNIPDKYFDDLFVKYLKYRLIVEYYRTAGINSTFTPSEPTTEIVNYRNVNCEIWMNIANTYLKAWGEKYPNSTKKQRILL